MKNLITILCLMVFAGSVYAEVYQIPGSYKETVTEVTVTDNGEKQAGKTETKTTKKWFKKRHKDLNPTNTYWNFGRPPFWTGSI